MAHRSDAASASARGLGDEARIAIAAILFRLFSAVVAFLANVTIPQYQDQGFSVFRTDHLFWDAFARYDAGWYHGIASQGYVFGAGGRNNLAFFPVYPLLMRAGGSLLGGRQQDFYFAGIVISWLAFACAMVLLYRLALADLPLLKHEHRGYTSLPPEERDRQSKRNFYRIIDRFGSRRDLLNRPGNGGGPGY